MYRMENNRGNNRLKFSIDRDASDLYNWNIKSKENPGKRAQ